MTGGQHEKSGAGGAEASPVSPFLKGLLCRCPYCGTGALFDGFLSLRKQCHHCSADLAGCENGDGPAVFVILILGCVVAFGALFVEVTWTPPYWVHLALWLPLILVGTAGLLRPFKATIIALQVHNDAGEGRLEDKQ